MFRFDSDSRTPIFGFNLLPKKRNDATFRDISQTSAHEDPPQLLQLSHDQPAEQRSKWTKWLNPLSKPKRIPLPKTELEPDMGAPTEIEPADALDYGF